MNETSPFPSERLAVLTAHLGDPGWVALLLRRVRLAFPGLLDDNVYVIDQDRTESSMQALRARLGLVNILRYPVGEEHMAVAGHDHPYVLNLAVREIPSDYLLLLDSDAHPTSAAAGVHLASLVDRFDAVLAAAGPEGTLCQGCFMLFGPTVDRDRLLFDAGHLDRGVDTGGEIFAQVSGMGLRAELLRPERAFGGRWGTFFLEQSIYHHGAGSFAANRQPWFQSQAAAWRREHEFIRRRVFRGRYRLSPLETWAFHSLRARRRLRTSAVRLASRI